MLKKALMTGVGSAWGTLSFTVTIVPGGTSLLEVVPAKIVLGLVLRLTNRSLLLLVSAIQRFPSESMVTPWGWFNDALVANPPSKNGGFKPAPATVLILPGSTTTPATSAALAERLMYRIRPRAIAP
jgi:hypothetical protein